MKTINKQTLIEIVKSLMLEPSDDVLEEIIQEWETIQYQLSFLNKINTENVLPLTHINEKPVIDFLREDIVDYSNSITKSNILTNASESDQDYIITSKVVK